MEPASAAFSGDVSGRGVFEAHTVCACVCTCHTYHTPYRHNQAHLLQTPNPKPDGYNGNRHLRILSCQGVSMMACRRNLKKEKRARNEACARQYRKAPKSRFRGRGGGPGGAARTKEDAADSEWLEQVESDCSRGRGEEREGTRAGEEAQRVVGAGRRRCATGHGQGVRKEHKEGVMEEGREWCWW